MSRTFQDRNFLVWEVYPSGGRHGYSANPQVVFNCLTQQDLRPRFVSVAADEAEAESMIARASEAELLQLLEQSREIG